jgi:chromate transporter
MHPAAFARTTHANAKGGRHAPALIDDDTPTPAHARFTSRRLALVVVTGVLLWSAAIGALMLAEHGERTLTQMAGFFTRAALLTFGGAYAVLPYVFQAAVETYGWITPAQMIDGLALGETTPGPLIMVVAFVGYVGASAKALFGTDARFAAGVAGACIATFFTFLPSFLFILAGGPLVERTHGQARFVAPLTGITAAVVGVIVNLAVFFALHVFQPHAGGWQGVDVTAVAIALLAGLALFRLRIGVIPVILAAAGAGVVLQLVRPLLPP